MLGFLNKILGGNKSQKDVKLIQPYVVKINEYYQQYQSLSNDELRHKTVEFKQRIQDHLGDIDSAIQSKQQQADTLPESEIQSKDGIYQEVDRLKKDRDKKIEEALEQILPEAFAVVKETARRFKENAEIISTATDLDRESKCKKRIYPYCTIFKRRVSRPGGIPE